MRNSRWISSLLAFGFAYCAACPALMRAQSRSLDQRRARATAAFHDGLLLLHANTRFDLRADGFQQDPYFYYFTGLQNTVGAIFALDGNTGQSWLFLPTHQAFAGSGFVPEALPGPESARRLHLDHVVDWSELAAFLSARAPASVSGRGTPLYFVGDSWQVAPLPPGLAASPRTTAPLWLQTILERYPTYAGKEVGKNVDQLMEVQDPEEMASVRKVAASTTLAFKAGLRAIHPGASQRSVELTVVDACWKQDAQGVAFWPWAMAGPNAVFPRPFTSLADYNHLDREMHSGELVRLDIGCQVDHYSGDLGRTVPVSGHFDEAQRETWEIFVAAYKAGLGTLRGGITDAEVYEAWRAELLRHRETAKTSLAQHAIARWSDRDQVPYWQIHTTSLIEGSPIGPLPVGATVNYEPIADVDGQAFFLEDMYLLTPGGAELLTPGVPYTADEIEAAIR